MNVEAFIELVHKGQKRLTGEKYTYHLYAVRDILKQEGVTSPIVLHAALLHDVLEDTDVTREYLEFWFGERIASIVFFLSKSEKVFWNTNYCRLQSHLNLLEECLRDYPEAILIKMADKLHNLRTIHGFRREKQIRYLDDVKNVFIPLFEKAKDQNVFTQFTDVVDSLLGKLRDDVQLIEKELNDAKKKPKRCL